MRVFVDTSAFVALRNRSEREHEAARDALRALLSADVRLITSNYVFAETYTALMIRVNRVEAIEWGRRARAGTALELVRVDEQLEDAAWAILEGHADKEWSYVDATSFALIDREKVDAAFAFDRHFEQRGLHVLPAQG
jgi:predicted nucleic acid-binding protein